MIYLFQEDVPHIYSLFASEIHAFVTAVGWQKFSDALPTLNINADAHKNFKRQVQL